MSIKYTMGLILLGILSIGCSNDSNEWLLIRLRNNSNYDFKNIIVNTSYTENIPFGNLEQGKSTDYKQFDKAYRYAFIILEIDGEMYSFQPDDYVGETPLKWGNYTYQIDLTDIQKANMELGLQLVRD